ncbi:hypothetical protein MBLNU230_g1479t1 [Neophaeotheca triangularis]
MASEGEIHRSSTYAPVNIAVIKYWGKRDPKLNLPTNSSLSVTLSQDDLRTHTTASCSPTYTTDTLTLNDAPQDLNTPRTQACLRALRAHRSALETANPSLPKLSSQPLRLISANNFPTAAGLASSAAGFAALVRSIADLYALPLTAASLSLIARQGSGSACRSLFGGYVGWKAGEAIDGSDSAAYQVAPASHWPEMRALILVASDKKKDISSTTGMQATVATSALFQTRAQHVVPQRMQAMTDAVRERDFAAFATLSMRDSNNFHATCLDTEPPIFYMNDTSRAAVRMCEAINAAEGRVVCGYTFDAGPNAVVYYLEKDESAVAGVFKGVLGEKGGWMGSRGGKVGVKSVPEGMESVGEMLERGVSGVILTRVGDGPRRVEEHLC